MWKPRLRAWAFIPILLSILIFGLLSWWMVYFLEPTVDQATAWLDDMGRIGFLGSILWVLIGAASLVVMAYSFVLVASLVACPFNALLAEAVEIRATGKKNESPSLGMALKHLPITLAQETKKLLYYVFWSIPVALVCLVTFFFMPPLAFLIWTLFSAWMIALEFCDYPMDNAGLKFAEMRRCLRKRRALVLGFGLAVFFFATIPLLNLLTVPAAVCGATVMWIEDLSLQSGRERA